MRVSYSLKPLPKQQLKIENKNIMSHCKTEKDTIIVPQGKAYRTWHNLETVCATDRLTKADARRNGLFPEILEGAVTASVGGRHVTLPNHKSLVARSMDGELHPLHISSQRYSIISNEMVWDTLSLALRGIDMPYKLTCAGTLCGLGWFFLSVAIGDEDGGFMVGDDKYLGNLNFMTSHTGEITLVCMDSAVRTVCMNTCQASLRGSHSFKLKVQHRGNTVAKCEDMGNQINEVLLERQRFIEAMDQLRATPVADTDIAPIIGGYFLKAAVNAGTDLSAGFGTRTSNHINGIADLARHGRGNRGETLYDIFNGVTEYYTHGDGTGISTPVGQQVFSSEFGGAATRKVDFGRYLVDNDHLSVVDEATRVLEIAG